MKVVICDHVFPDIEQEKKELACIPDLELIDACCTCKEDVIAACAARGRGAEPVQFPDRRSGKDI